jgi:hypothetical protein
MGVPRFPCVGCAAPLTLAEMETHLKCPGDLNPRIIHVGDGMVPIDRCASIRARLASPAKLSRAERASMETRISNWSGNGLLSDDEYRVVTRALHEHA